MSLIKILKRREIFVLLTLFSGIMMILNAYFALTGGFLEATETVQAFVAGISAFAILVGTGTILIYQAREVGKRVDEWYYRVWSMFLVVLIPVLGVLGMTKAIDWFTIYISIPANSTIYGTTLFWGASAAYRAFKLRNIDAAAVLIPAIILMIFNATLYSSWLLTPIVPVGNWIRDIPTTAGFRGVAMGTAFGICVAAFRNFTGIERTMKVEVAEAG